MSGEHWLRIGFVAYGLTMMAVGMTAAFMNPNGRWYWPMRLAFLMGMALALAAILTVPLWVR